MSAALERLTPEKRLEIARTRLIKPVLRAGELVELAGRYGVSEGHVQRLRREYAEAHEVPIAPPGRIPNLPNEAEAELNLLLDLRDLILCELSIASLAKRFRASRSTIGKQVTRRRKERQALKERAR